MRNLAETVLAFFAGRDRAAAIYGDLLELAPSHSHRWFLATYMRSLISVSWRASAALLAAYAFSTWMVAGAFGTVRSIFRTVFHIPRHAPVQASWHVFNRFVHYSNSSLTLFGYALIALWFIFPFVLVRFGLRDRLTQLTTASFVFTLPYFSLVPQGITAALCATAAIILAALCLRSFRRPFIVLAACVILIALAQYASSRLWLYLVFRGRHDPSYPMTLLRLAVILAGAILCSRLYRRFHLNKSDVVILV